MQKVEEKENLEMQKLRSENQVLVNQLIDFPKVKRDRNIAIGVAIVELIVLIATLILSSQK